MPWRPALGRASVRLPAAGLSLLAGFAAWRSPAAFGPLAFLIGPPLALAAVSSPAAALALAAVSATVTATALLLDPAAGAPALSAAAVPALVLALLAAGVHDFLARVWRPLLEGPAWSLPAALGAALVGLVALAQPLQPHAEVDAQAAFARVLRGDPALAFDAGESPALQLLAAPLAAALGDTTAMQIVACLGLASLLLLAHALARCCGLGPGAALGAQLTLALSPLAWRLLVRGPLPALLGQTLEALLAVHLVRRFSHLDGARDAGAAALVLLLAQAASTRSLFAVGASVAAFALVQASLGERRRAARLLAAYGVATALVGFALYGRLLPGLLQAGLAPPSPAPGLAGLVAAQPARLASLLGWVPLLLAPLGALALRGAPAHARRWLLASLLGGLGLYALGAVGPVVLRGAPDVGLLALPAAVATAAALEWLVRRGGSGRLLAATAALALLVTGVGQAAGAFASNGP